MPLYTQLLMYAKFIYTYIRSMKIGAIINIQLVYYIVIDLVLIPILRNFFKFSKL